MAWKKFTDWLHPDLDSIDPGVKASLYARSTLILFIMLFVVLLVTSRVFLFSIGSTPELYQLDKYFPHFFVLTLAVIILHFILNNKKADFYILMLVIFIIASWAVVKDMENLAIGYERYGVLFLGFLFFGLIFMPFRPFVSLLLGVYSALLVIAFWTLELQPNLHAVKQSTVNSGLLMSWYAVQYVIFGIAAMLIRAANLDQYLKTFLTSKKLAYAEEDLEALRSLLLKSESQFIEFKSSVRYDYHKRQLNRDLEHQIVKTIAGFMNSRGGTLVIGVDDNGNPLGLDNDMMSLKRRDTDGFEQFVITLIANGLGKESCSNLRISFIREEDKDICIIRVLPNNKPVFVKQMDHAVYVRTGNNTQRLNTKEALEYIQKHFQK